MQPRTLTKPDPQRVMLLDDEDVKENALIYLHQLNELQKAEWQSWYCQITTFGIFNEGATHWRNREWFGDDHFTRLINMISPVVHSSFTKFCDEGNFQNMLDTYNEAFSGCLMINAMGSEIGKVSSYHVMLRRWMNSIQSNRLENSDSMTEVLNKQWKNYQKYCESLAPSTESKSVLVNSRKY